MPSKDITKWISLTCEICNKEFMRLKCAMKGTKTAICGIECSKKWRSIRLAEMNVELNPDRMTQKTKEKLRLHRLGKGEGKTYTKTYGRHTHRIVMEQKIGRKLRPGEVVHHIDENRRNNDPDNLKLFANQAEHARHHKLKDIADAKLKNDKQK